jgi:hypothetical protein
VGNTSKEEGQRGKVSDKTDAEKAERNLEMRGIGVRNMSAI